MHPAPIQVPLRYCYHLSTPRHLPLHLRSAIHPSSISLPLFHFLSSSPCLTSYFLPPQSRENDAKPHSNCLTVSHHVSQLEDDPIERNPTHPLSQLEDDPIERNPIHPLSQSEDDPIERNTIHTDASARETKTPLEIPKIMWLAEARAALGQRLNVEGILASVRVYVNEPHLALPHMRVPDVRYIDWEELRRHGFKGVVFDKDNTITAPYSLAVWGPLVESIAQCKSSFGDEIAVLSNSAGLEQYDHDGRKAEMLEKSLGIRVIRHKSKKPAGACEELEKHFSCKSDQLVMVGDRSFTDVVYGNRNGLFTILTEPFCVAEEPFVVSQVRKLESSILNYWFGRGLKPTPHGLVTDPGRFAKGFRSS